MKNALTIRLCGRLLVLVLGLAITAFFLGDLSDPLAQEGKAEEAAKPAAEKAGSDAEEPAEKADAEAPLFSEAEIKAAMEEYGVKAVTETITGVARDQDGKPLAGVTIRGSALLSWVTPQRYYNLTTKSDGSPPKEYKYRRSLEPTALDEISYRFSPNTTTGADGSYKLKGLANGSYYLSAFLNGYQSRTHSVSGGVTPGQEFDFIFERQASLPLKLLLPDGKEPKEAFITAKLIEGYGSHGNPTYRWAPDDRSIPVTPGIYQISAKSEDEALASPMINVSTFDLESLSELTLELTPRTGVRITLSSEIAGDQLLIGWEGSGLYVYALPAGALNVKVRNLASFGIPFDQEYSFTTGSYTYVNYSIPAGEYTLIVVESYQILTKSTFEVRDGEVTVADVEAPAPKREDYVALTIKGLNALEMQNLQLRAEYTINGNRRQSSSYHIVHQKDGSIWVPHSHAEEDTDLSRPEREVTYTVRATSRTRGAITAAYEKGKESAATITFGPPAMLKVRITNFSSINNYHRHARLAFFNPEDLNGLAENAQPRSTYGVSGVNPSNMIDGQGVLLILGMAVGDVVMHLNLGWARNGNAMLSLPLDIKPGLNEATITIPPIITLNVELPKGDNTHRPVTFQIVRDGVVIESSYATKEKPATFEYLTPGVYEIRTGSKPNFETMKIEIKSDTTVTFVADE